MGKDTKITNPEFPDRLLNLYSGLGGNRFAWKYCSVTAVESNPIILNNYRLQFPKDKIFCCDAHQFLLDCYKDFNFIWSSIPCVTHSQLNFVHKEKRYPDMKLYEEILFLQHFCKDRLWVVENVKAYNAPLIKPTIQIGRHNFWSNFVITPFEIPVFPGIGEGSLRE